MYKFVLRTVIQFLLYSYYVLEYTLTLYTLLRFNLTLL